MVCAVFGSGPSTVVAVRFAAFMFGAVLTVFISGIFTQTLVAVMIPTVHILATTIFAQVSALEAAAVDAVGLKIANRHFTAPVTHILLGLCHDRLCRLGGGVGCLRFTV